MQLKPWVSERRGRTAELARSISVVPVLVSQWAEGRRQVPAQHCPQIERATEGQVPCERLRTDIAWHRVPDPAWPWHPDGRPLIDVTRNPEVLDQALRADG